MASGSSASSLTVTFCGEPLRLVTSSAIADWSPGVMKRGVFSSATMGAATTISASVLPKLSAVNATAIRRACR